MAATNKHLDQTAQTVRHQYEDYPYPERNAEDERKRLIRTFPATLETINHYCFKGRRDFRKGFRALVAGGGTGDSTIWLAEQLKDTDATILHLDISEASIAVAKSRATIRGLTNITWMHGSLLDLPTMGLDPFDYIECTGVLHHLIDPPAGLAALRGSLTDDGCMGIMLYGQYGRTGVYQMQELMRRINNEQDDSQQKVDNAQAMLAGLPASNWFKRGEELIKDHQNSGGANIYDLLLHSQDRAYTIPELYEFFETCDLNIIEFMTGFRHFYNPERIIADQSLLARISALPLRRQRAIGELLSGAIIKHTCYVSPQTDTVADIDDLDNIPIFSQKARKGFTSILDGPKWAINAPPLPRLAIVPHKFARAGFKLIDGIRTSAQIAGLVSEQFAERPSIEKVHAEFAHVFRILCEWGDVMLLRHPLAGEEISVDA
jgi:SAM-dependent methyltransferase